ncbi:MAG: substrate-binding domain-containing protein [Candidatus Binatia bacterium]
MSITSAQAATAEIKVLSAGAIKTGLANLAKAFHEEGGHKVIITFATAPVLRGKVEKDDTTADIVIAPIPTMNSFEDNGRVVAGSMAVLGRIRAAAVVRAGVPEPDISTAEALKKEILPARSLVYNQASSGLYVEKLMGRLGAFRGV